MNPNLGPKMIDEKIGGPFLLYTNFTKKTEYTKKTFGRKVDLTLYRKENDMGDFFLLWKIALTLTFF